MMRATPESPRMFDSNFVDFFSRTPYYTIPILYTPMVLACVYYASVVCQIPWYFLLFQGLLGVFVWTFNEYTLHRFVFHWVPPGRWGERFHFIIHGCHHKWYDDPYRLVMPPAAGLTIAAIYFGIFSLIGMALAPFVDPTWIYMVFAGKVATYVYYDLTHYSMHHGKQKSRRAKRLRAHHMNHHFNNTDRKYGFITTFWDRVFRTM